jgi:hypothetical protein
MARLLACPSCARHVRDSESSCPFCQAAMGSLLRETPLRAAPAGRMSRNALYAFGVASVTLAAACSGKVSTGSGDSGPDSMAVAAYGCPAGCEEVDARPDTNESTDAAEDFSTVEDGPSFDASDASDESDASDAQSSDAGTDGHASDGGSSDAHADADTGSGIAPSYGLPPEHDH